MESIKLENLDKQLKEYRKDKRNDVVRHAISKTNLSTVVRSQDEIENVNFDFEINVRTLSAANQRQSGRCWIFAATNVLREMIAKQHNFVIIQIHQG